MGTGWWTTCTRVHDVSEHCTVEPELRREKRKLSNSSGVSFLWESTTSIRSIVVSYYPCTFFLSRFQLDHVEWRCYLRCDGHFLELLTGYRLVERESRYFSFSQERVDVQTCRCVLCIVQVVNSQVQNPRIKDRAYWHSQDLWLLNCLQW